MTFAAAVGLVYAAQQIIGTKEVSATVNIVTAAQFLRTCHFDDNDCTTAFTGDLPFGDMSRGAPKTVNFRIKNTQATGGSGFAGGQPYPVQQCIDQPYAQGWG